MSPSTKTLSAPVCRTSEYLSRIGSYPLFARLAGLPYRLSVLLHTILVAKGVISRILAGSGLLITTFSHTAGVQSIMSQLPSSDR